MKNISPWLVGNNGNQLAEVLHDAGELKDGMKDDEIEKIARPYMFNEKWLREDDFWVDFYYRAEELGYKLSY